MRLRNAAWCGEYHLQAHFFGSGGKRPRGSLGVFLLLLEGDEGSDDTRASVLRVLCQLAGSGGGAGTDAAAFHFLFRAELIERLLNLDNDGTVKDAPPASRDGRGAAVWLQRLLFAPPRLSTAQQTPATPARGSGDRLRSMFQALEDAEAQQQGAAAPSAKGKAAAATAAAAKATTPHSQTSSQVSTAATQLIEVLMGVHGGGGSAVHGATLLRALLTPLATTLQKQTDTAGLEYLTLLVRCAAARDADGLGELVAALVQLPGLQPPAPSTPPASSAEEAKPSVVSAGVGEISAEKPPPPSPAKQESSLLLPQPVLALLYALLWRARGCLAAAGEDPTEGELNASLSSSMCETGRGGLAAEGPFSATSSEAGEEPSSAFARGMGGARGGARVVVRNLQVSSPFIRHLCSTWSRESWWDSCGGLTRV